MSRRYRGARRDKALLMLNPIARWETPPAPILGKGGWAPGLEWTMWTKWVSFAHRRSQSGSPSLYRVATLSALYPPLWIAQFITSRYTECPIPTPLDRPVCTESLHWVPYTHSSGSPSMYRVATLSALYPLLCIAQPVPSRYTECLYPPLAPHHKPGNILSETWSHHCSDYEECSCTGHQLTNIFLP